MDPNFNIEINLWKIIKGSFLILLRLWPIWIFLLFAITIKLFSERLYVKIDDWKIGRKFRQGEKWRSDRDLLQWLRGMEPSEFENYIADLFSRLGYKTKAVGDSYDKGVDVVIEKDGVKSYIQCKKFISSKVTVGDVRNFYGALADHLTNGKGYFVTTNKFTLEAEKFADDKPIELIDGYKLVRYIKMAKKDKGEPKEDLKICPRCGGNLVQRNGKFGPFYGCSNYPKCNYTLKQDKIS